MPTLFNLQGTKLYFENGVCLGEVLEDVDGFKKWWPDNKGGYLDGPFLIALGQFLNELNAPWQAEIDAYFKAHS